MYLRLEQEYHWPESILYQYHAAHIYLLFVQVSSKQPYLNYRYELFQYLNENIIKSDTQNIWNQPKELLLDHCYLIENCVDLAKNQLIIQSKVDKTDFLFYLIQSHQIVANRDLRSMHCIPEVNPFRIKGLRWIIKCMNEDESRIKPDVYSET